MGKALSSSCSTPSLEHYFLGTEETLELYGICFGMIFFILYTKDDKTNSVFNLYVRTLFFKIVLEIPLEKKVLKNMNSHLFSTRTFEFLNFFHNRHVISYINTMCQTMPKVVEKTLLQGLCRKIPKTLYLLSNNIFSK